MQASLEIRSDFLRSRCASNMAQVAYNAQHNAPLFPYFISPKAGQHPLNQPEDDVSWTFPDCSPRRHEVILEGVRCAVKKSFSCIKMNCCSRAGTLRGSSILFSALTIPYLFPCIESVSDCRSFFVTWQNFLQPFAALTRVGEAARESL